MLKNTTKILLIVKYSKKLPVSIRKYLADRIRTNYRDYQLIGRPWVVNR